MLQWADVKLCGRRRALVTAMWHALVWIPLMMLMALWSLLCWGALALLTGPDWSSGGPADWMVWLERWQIPLWLVPWLPMDGVTALKAWLTTLGPWLQSLLAQVPALLDWLAPLVWLVWTLGAAGLLVLGVVGSVIVALVSPQGKPGSPNDITETPR